MRAVLSLWLVFAAHHAPHHRAAPPAPPSESLDYRNDWSPNGHPWAERDRRLSV